MAVPHLLLERSMAVPHLTLKQQQYWRQQDVGLASRHLVHAEQVGTFHTAYSEHHGRSSSQA